MQPWLMLCVWRMLMLVYCRSIVHTTRVFVLYHDRREKSRHGVCFGDGGVALDAALKLYPAKTRTNSFDSARCSELADAARSSR